MDINFSDYPPFSRDAYGRLSYQDEPIEVTRLRESIDRQIMSGIIRFLERPENMRLYANIVSLTHERLRETDVDRMYILCLRTIELADTLYHLMDVDRWIIDAPFRKLMWQRGLTYLYMRILGVEYHAGSED